jgi:hypothetical protein
MTGRIEEPDDTEPPPVDHGPPAADREPGGDAPAEDPTAATGPDDPPDGRDSESIDRAIERELGHHPEVAEVVGVLVEDHDNHPL